MEKQDLAILYSGGRKSLLLYALALAGHHPEISRPHSIHLLHMLNGMGRFHSFPLARYQLACGLLERQIPRPDQAPQTRCLELDMGRLLQDLWLNRCEELMPRFNGKNLVCVACNLGMHVKGLLYCITHHVPLLLAGCGARSSCCSQQAEVFMERVAALSKLFGITTKFPLYGETDKHTVRHLLEEFGLPSAGGGERNCLFSQTLTSAGAKEIDDYLEVTIPLVVAYMEHSLAGRVQVAAACFSLGMVPC